MKKCFLYILAIVFLSHTNIYSQVRNDLVLPKQVCDKSCLQQRDTTLQALNNVRKALDELKNNAETLIQSWKQFSRHNWQHIASVKSGFPHTELVALSTENQVLKNILSSFNTILDLLPEMGSLYLSDISYNPSHKQRWITLFKDLQQITNRIYTQIIAPMQKKLKEESFMAVLKTFNGYFPLEITSQSLQIPQARLGGALDRLVPYIEKSDTHLLKQDVVKVKKDMSLLQTLITQAEITKTISEPMQQQAKSIFESFKDTLAIVSLTLAYVQNTSLKAEWKSIEQEFKNIAHKQNQVKIALEKKPGGQEMLNFINLVIQIATQSLGSMSQILSEPN